MRFHSEHHVIEEISSGVFSMLRTSTSFATLADCEQEFAAMLRWLSSRPRTHALLVDLRSARGRNDPEFEAVLASGRRALFRRFEHLACLVGTLPGKMQLERYAREDGVAVSVFLRDEDAARWLASRDPPLQRVAR